MAHNDPYIELKDGFYQIPEASINKLGKYMVSVARLADTSMIEQYQFTALENACHQLGILNSEEFDQQGTITSITLCDFNHRYDVGR